MTNTHAALYRTTPFLLSFAIALGGTLTACDQPIEGPAHDALDADLELIEDAEMDAADQLEGEISTHEQIPDAVPHLVAEPDVQLDAWTLWYDRDNPGGNGDYESAPLQVGVCPAPTGVECRTTGGLALWQTGEVVTCSTSAVACVNNMQPDGYCDHDYIVRFLCP